MFRDMMGTTFPSIWFFVYMFIIRKCCLIQTYGKFLNRFQGFPLFPSTLFSLTESSCISDFLIPILIERITTNLALLWGNRKTLM